MRSRNMFFSYPQRPQLLRLLAEMPGSCSTYPIQDTFIEKNSTDKSQSLKIPRYYTEQSLVSRSYGNE